MLLVLPTVNVAAATNAAGTVNAAATNAAATNTAATNAAATNAAATNAAGLFHHPSSKTSSKNPLSLSIIKKIK